MQSVTARDHQMGAYGKMEGPGLFNALENQNRGRRNLQVFYLFMRSLASENFRDQKFSVYGRQRILKLFIIYSTPYLGGITF